METQDVKDRKDISICQSGNSDSKNTLLRESRSGKEVLYFALKLWRPRGMNSQYEKAKRFHSAFISRNYLFKAVSEEVIL